MNKPNNLQFMANFSSTFILISRGVTGQDLMSCLTTKNV